MIFFLSRLDYLIFVIFQQVYLLNTLRNVFDDLIQISIVQIFAIGVYTASIIIKFIKYCLNSHTSFV